MAERLEELLRVAEVLLLGGEAEEALAILDQAVAVAPDDPLPYLRRAELLMRLDSVVGAQRVAPQHRALVDLDRAVALGADSAAVHFQRMTILAGRGDLPAARAAHRQAVERLADDDSRLRAHLREWGIRLALQAGDSDEALALVRAAKKDAPDSFHWAWREVNLLRDRGKYAAARDTCTALLDARAPADPVPGTWEAPRWAGVYLARAEAHRRLGAFEAALADLAAAEAFQPGDPGVPFARGLVAWRQGDVDGAFRPLRAGLESAGPGLRAAFWQELPDYPRLDGLRAALEEKRLDV